MDGYPQFLDFIDTRSFSSVWYWIALATAWGVAAYRPLGVPFDMVRWARSRGGAATADLESVARALAVRLVSAMERGGVWAVAVASAAYTVLILLGFAYGIELAQAVLLLTFPLSISALATLATAKRIVGGRGDVALHLRRLRRMIQIIGLAAIFVTAVWGMYVNLGRSLI